jgi:hypothetical protein
MSSSGASADSESMPNPTSLRTTTSEIGRPRPQARTCSRAAWAAPQSSRETQRQRTWRPSVPLTARVNASESTSAGPSLSKVLRADGSSARSRAIDGWSKEMKSVRSRRRRERTVSSTAGTSSSSRGSPLPGAGGLSSSKSPTPRGVAQSSSSSSDGTRSPAKAGPNRIPASSAWISARVRSAPVRHPSWCAPATRRGSRPERRRQSAGRRTPRGPPRNERRPPSPRWCSPAKGERAAVTHDTKRASRPAQVGAGRPHSICAPRTRPGISRGCRSARSLG